MKRLKLILQSKYLFVGLLLITIIYSTFYFTIQRTSKLNLDDISYVGIISKIEASGDLLKLELRGKENIIGNYFFKTNEEKITFLNEYKLGDKVNLTGSFSLPKNNTVPNLFNYKEYLKRKGIYYIMQIDEIELIQKNQNLFYKIKNVILEHIDNYQSKGYLRTFVLGDTSFLEDDTIKSYQENGISHLFAISGMHISLLSGILLFLLRKVKLEERKSYFVIILFLLFYMVLSGNSPSICRAVILFILLCINRIFKLRIPTLSLLILTFCILVLINPYLLFEVGFQYSFMISFYLILLQKKLNSTSYIKGLIQVSLISFLVSFPISIYYFYQINIFSIFLNLIFVPLVSFIVFPVSLLTFLLPFLDTVFLVITNLMEELSFLFGNVSIFEMIWIKPDIWWIISYYLILTICLYCRKKAGWLFIIGLLLYQYFQLVIIPRSFFMVVDVGQGDSLLIHSNNQTMLIDTGGKITYEKEKWQERNIKSLAETTLLPLLKSLGIRSLDYLVLSHGDFDHSGEAINLIHNIKIKNIIFNGGLFNKQEKVIIDLLNNKKIPYIIDEKDNQYQVGDFRLLSLNSFYEDENDSSIVFLMKIKDYNFLLMGDSSSNVEQRIIQEYSLPTIDFLKVGHHGSKTSSSCQFIEEISPRFAFISVGLNNRYQHPSNEVIERLEKNNVQTLLTSVHGTIQLNFKKDVTFSINPP